MTPALRTPLLVASILALASAVSAQTIGPDFAADYSANDLGPVPGVPAPYGAIAFKAGDASTLFISGAAESAAGAVYEIGITRDGNGHVTGFSGSATTLFAAPDISSGLAYAENGTLLFTTTPGNLLGQVLPGSSSVDKYLDLTVWGIGWPMGAGRFVPSGLQKAGQFRTSSYGNHGWYNLTLVPDGAGTYKPVGANFVLNFPLWPGPHGFDYVDAANLAFATDTVLMAEFDAGLVSAYELSLNGEPSQTTRRQFMDLSGVYGAVKDPISGDMVFSTFTTGSPGRVVVVQGFDAPHNFCTSRLTSTGCYPGVQFAGSPTASGPDDFVLTCTEAPNNVPGIMIWSLSPGTLTAFHGATLCLGKPIRRRAPQASGGNSGKATDCSGTFQDSIDQAFLSSHGMTPGTPVYCQYFGRDPGYSWPNNIMTSNALGFTVLQ